MVDNSLILFYCHAVSKDPMSYKYVDEIWNKDPVKYISATKSNKLQNMAIIRCMSTERQMIAKKFLNIIAYCQQEDSYEDIHCFLKKYSSAAYKYLTTHEVLDIFDYVEFMSTSNSDATQEDLSISFVSLIFLFEVSGKEITYRYKDKIKEETNKVLSKFFRHQYKNTTKEKKKAVADLEKRLLDRYGEIHDYDDLLMLMDKHNMKDIMHLFDNRQIDLSRTLIDYYIPQEDLRDILLSYIKSLRSTTDLHAVLEYVITQAIILLFVHEYRSTQEYFFNSFPLIIENEKAVQAQVAVAQPVAIKTYEKELEAVQKKLDEANDEIFQLQRDKAKLQKEISQMEENKEELKAFRELFHSLATESEDDDDDDCDIDYNVLKNTKAVIVGGRRKWQAKLKKALPHFIFIDTDALNFDTKVLEGTDTVFVHTNYISHALYYKIVGAAEKRGIKLEFLNEQNDRLALKKICESYQQ